MKYCEKRQNFNLKVILVNFSTFFCYKSANLSETQAFPLEPSLEKIHNIHEKSAKFRENPPISTKMPQLHDNIAHFPETRRKNTIFREIYENSLLRWQNLSLSWFNDTLSSDMYFFFHSISIQKSPKITLIVKNRIEDL